MFKDFGKNNKGFSLIEIIVVTAIVTTAFMGVIVLVKKSIVIRHMNQNYLVASQLANEGIELSRNVRNENWLRGNDFNKNLIDLSKGDDIYYVIDYNVRPGYKGSISSSSMGRESIWSEEGGIDYYKSLNILFKASDLKEEVTRLNVIIDNEGNKFYSHKNDEYDNISTSEASIFHRIMKTTYNEDSDGVNYMTIEARIYWQERGKDKYYNISTNLYDYDWYH